MRSLLRCLLISVLCAFSSAVAFAQADETIYTKVDENPVPIKTPPPKYPDSLKREGVSGVVAVVLVIDEKGAIMSSNISKASHPDFERPALDAVKNWKFKPAKKDGNAVKVKVTIPLRFNVDEG